MATKDLNVSVGIIVKDVQKELNKLDSQLRSFSSRLVATGRDLSSVISLPLLGGAAAAVKASVDFDRLRKALETVTGSSEAAQAELDKLRKIAELPGISFEQATKATLSLRGLGFEAEKTRATITGVGKAIALSGGSEANFEGAIRQLSQIQAKGKVLQQDITVLLENMPVLGKIMQDTFGAATAEGIRKAGVSGGEFVDTLIEKLNELPPVQGGLALAFENLGIAGKFALASIGSEISTVFNLQKIFEDLTARINRGVDIFRSLDEETKRSILRFAGYAAAAGPALIVTGRLFSAVNSFRNGLASLSTQLVGAISSLVKFSVAEGAVSQATVVLTKSIKALYLTVGLGVVLLIAAQFIEWSKQIKAASTALDENNSELNAYAQAVKEGEAAASAQIKVVDALIATVKDENKSQKERVAALQQLQREYPGYFENIRTDLSNINLLKDGYDRLSSAILQSAKARAASAKLQDLATSELDLRDQAIAAEKQLQAELLKIREAGFRDAETLRKRVQQNTELLGTTDNGAFFAQAKASAQLLGSYERASRALDEIISKEEAVVVQQQKIAELAASYQDTVKETPTLYSGKSLEQQKEAEKLQAKINKKYDETLDRVNAIAITTDKLSLPEGEGVRKQIVTVTRAFEDLVTLGLDPSSDRAKVLSEKLEELKLKLAEVVGQSDVLEPIDISEKFIGIDRFTEIVGEASKLTKESFSNIPDFFNSLQGLSDVEASKDLEELDGIFKDLSQSITNFSTAAAEANLAERFQAISDGVSAFQELLSPLQDGIESFITTVFEGGKDAFGEFTKSFLKGIAQMIAKLVAAIAAAAILSALLNAIFPGIGAAGGFGSLLSQSGGGSLTSILKLLRIPGLAAGGIVTAPTLLVAGEGGENEAIFPLSKLDSLLASNDTQSDQFVVRGEDLVLVLDRAQRSKTRFTGKF